MGMCFREVVHAFVFTFPGDISCCCSLGSNINHVLVFVLPYGYSFSQDNMKDMIKFCMTRHETEIRKLAETPLGGQRFELLIRRYEMYNEPIPVEASPLQQYVIISLSLLFSGAKPVFLRSFGNMEKVPFSSLDIFYLSSITGFLTLTLLHHTGFLPNVPGPNRNVQSMQKRRVTSTRMTMGRMIPTFLQSASNGQDRLLDHRH